jgi:hypothetical protein
MLQPVQPVGDALAITTATTVAVTTGPQLVHPCCNPATPARRRRNRGESARGDELPERAPVEPALHPRGRPSTRSATMLRWISDVPPAMVPEKERRYCRAQAPS